MMRDTKGRKIVRHIALAVLALLSIGLSWVIWTNPARYGAKGVSTEKVQSNQVSRDMSDVILPTQIVYTNTDKKQTLINNSTTSVSKTVVKELSKWKMASINRVSRGNKERFLDYARMPKSLVLKYPSNITGKIFNGIYRQKLETNTEISQIVVNVDKKDEFFLLNDKTYDVYQVKITKQSLSKLGKLAKNSNQGYAVEETILNHKLINDYPSKIKMPYYGFLINKESSSVFTANLLTNTNADSIDTKKVSDGVEYVANDNTKRLLVQNNGHVIFNNTSKNKSSNSLKGNIEKSFLQMKQLGIHGDNMRYFNFLETQRQTEFIQYVAGFPIFNSDGLSEIKVANQARQLTTTFSVYNLDVPVPTTKAPKELDNTEDTLTELGIKGIDTKKVEDMDIGYQWSGTPKENATVELEPTWYIKYRGEWSSYHDLTS